MTKAQNVWDKYKAADLSLVDQWNYYGKLTAQFPIAPIRVACAASGTVPCALVLEDRRAVIEHSIYWAAVTSVEEGLYLAAILGSEAARKRVENLQSRGQWGARHFDKVMFTLPIPRFDSNDALHKSLAVAGAGGAEDRQHGQVARRRTAG